MIRTPLLLLALALVPAAPRATRVRGDVVDAATGKPIPCRITIRGADGAFHFARSGSPEGTAVPYRKQSGTNKASVEMHVTLSAHPFEADLPAGAATITVERGKEYLPETRTVEVGVDPLEVSFKLRRWIDVSARGWYSGETHVHRSPDELPNVMAAEDLNVALPLTSWVTDAFASPRTSSKTGAPVLTEPRVIEIDKTHVFYPRNTEYEIFRVGTRSHTLGAIFILNHKSLFETGVPPLGPIVKKAREEGALLELDKHNWPWSMALVPVHGVDLYELANNHMWATEFGFRQFGAPAPEYMAAEKDDAGWTERGWIDYTFQNYYALLDCGLRLRPTAGSASGVHPVPLGFGRVYVRLEGEFSYEKWMRGLNEGRSFATTGPMLFVDFDGGVLTGIAESAAPLARIELIVNGEVARTIKPANTPTPRGGFESPILERVEAEGSYWAAVRCFEDRPDRRPRYAHTAPWHVDVPGKPLRPRRVEAEFLVRRVEEELARSGPVLPEPALEEYRQALRFYQEKLKEAR